MVALTRIHDVAIAGEGLERGRFAAVIECIRVGNLDYLREICDEIGKVRSFGWQCLGTYYINIDNNKNPFVKEFSIVEKKTESISIVAKAYGKPLASHPDILLYQIVDVSGDRAVIQHEIAKYRVRSDLHLFNDESLHTLEVYGADLNPEYFGAFLAPIITPHGLTPGYEAIVDGVYALETDCVETMIAICYPIWNANVSDYTMKYAEQTDSYLYQGLHSTTRYIFFSEEHGVLALLELVSKFPQILTSDAVSHPLFTMLFGLFTLSMPQSIITKNKMAFMTHIGCYCVFYMAMTRI